MLVHGGMAQNVGPILEMVTEKYLLRSGAEWKARQEAINLLVFDRAGVAEGPFRTLGSLTTQNFSAPSRPSSLGFQRLYRDAHRAGSGRASGRRTGAS